MDIDTDDDVLGRLSKGESMEYEQWPDLLTRLIPRIEKIAQEEFLIPTLPAPPALTASSFTTQIAGETSSQASTSSNQSAKENDPPQDTLPPGTLPPPIQALLTGITTTLTSLFQTHPPHTIQRLAELVLNPKQHYKTLPSYLHALDRVVHVTSGAHIFPLPPAIPDPASATILSNGTIAPGVDPLSVSWGNSATASSLGSDESLGGALLTPITWLTNKNGSSHGSHSPMEGEVKTESTEMVEGPNGLGGVETVTVSVNGISSTRSEESLAASLRAEGGVTQGELLRQEQRAGVVPAAQLAVRGSDPDDMGEDDELPHARGPEKIGMEDMGPQAASISSERTMPGVTLQGIDVEAAVGRRITDTDAIDEEEDTTEPSTSKREAEEELGGEEKRVKDDAKEAEAESVNADGKVLDEGADAVDTAAI